MVQTEKISKRLVMAAILAGIMILLVSCTAKQPEEILEKAPDMEITNGKESLVLPRGTGEWNYHVKGEEWSGYVACGAHPVQNRYEENVNTLESLDGSFTVSFDTVPDSVRVTVWTEDEWTNEEEVFPEGEILTLTTGEEGSWHFTIPQEGDIICEIFAEWEQKEYYGNSSYCVLICN